MREASHSAGVSLTDTLQQINQPVQLTFQLDDFFRIRLIRVYIHPFQ